MRSPPQSVGVGARRQMMGVIDTTGIKVLASKALPLTETTTKMSFDDHERGRATSWRPFCHCRHASRGTNGIHDGTVLASKPE